jgi:hypothetical protein
MSLEYVFIKSLVLHMTGVALALRWAEAFDGGDWESSVMQEVMRDAFPAIVEGNEVCDVAMMLRLGDVEMVLLFGMSLTIVLVTSIIAGQ